jgi:antirestriction protein ArdC
MDKVEKEITDEIISKLQQGTIPWHQTWKSGLPANAVTRKPYKGINIWLLGDHKYQSNLWLTFNQTKLLDGIVNKGEHGRQIVYWQIKTRIREDDLGDEHRDEVPLLRTYTVFNIEQTTIDTETETKVSDPIAEAQRIVDGYDDGPEIVSGEPSYSIELDKIRIPSISSFDSPDEYYSTLFHELSHSTGHSKRLNQDFKNSFGSDSYAEEEIIVEMSASFLSGIAGVGVYNKTIENSAAYIQHWINRFADNTKLIIRLSSQAQKSTDWILGNGQPDGDDQLNNSIQE